METETLEGTVHVHESAARLAETLSTIADRRRLEILMLLDSSDLTAAEVAGALALSTEQARRHLRGLVDAGLVDTYPTNGAYRFRVNRNSAALLNASIVSLLGRTGLEPGSTAATAVDEADVVPMAVPTPPDNCMRCQNASFVEGVLGDLRGSLEEAERYQSRLKQLSIYALTAHEQERKRIARELHDDTAQALTSVLVRLRLLERSVDDSKLRNGLEELRDLTADTLDSVRRMAVTLRPAALDDLGLVAALRAFVERFSERWLITIEFSASGIKRRLPLEVELALYRVVQEALTNVAKHSGASRASVKLSRRRQVVKAVVEDNGRGFAADEIEMEGTRTLGIFGMKERLALIGGTLEIDSQPGEGTSITAQVPLPGRGRQVQG